jgi:hypothetical protein
LDSLNHPSTIRHRLNIFQGRSLLFGFDTSFTKHQDLRNDKEKRDFVACGGAAGMNNSFFGANSVLKC